MAGADRRGGGAFKLTVARWLTPAKRWIHQVGLTPDVVVTLPDPVPAGTDPTLDKALEILAGTAPRRSTRRPPDRSAALAHRARIEYGFWERKEVMCSDRQYA